MTWAFLTIALVTLATAGVAMALRNLIHSALLLVTSWAGIAAFYLWAGAEFIAFAQVLVYVGAVSMIVLFAVLLTRRSLEAATLQPDSVSRAIAGLVIGGAVLGVLFGAVMGTPLQPTEPPPHFATVHDIGISLMNNHIAAVLIAGVILTVALLGGVVLAATDLRREKEETT